MRVSQQIEFDVLYEEMDLDDKMGPALDEANMELCSIYYQWENLVDDLELELRHCFRLSVWMVSTFLSDY